MKNNAEINVLLAPLNWGIGHASRCVPIIEYLINNKYTVFIASDGRAADFLKQEFPHLKHLELNSYHVQYSKSGKTLLLKILSQIPKIVYAIYKEHQKVKEIVNQNHIDIIISDNRYGMYCKKTYSVLMTHQLCLRMPKKLQNLENLVHYLLKSRFKKFDELWVPDFESGFNLSGELSHKYKAHSNLHYIGILSRFSKFDCPTNETLKTNDILVLLSGPEPQRSIFENIVISELKNTDFKCVILKGTTEKKESFNISHKITIHSHLSTNEIAMLINQSKIIISRTGYSTIMDLYALKTQAILVPTPGQTEQEYLADLIKEKQLFYVLSQDEVNSKIISDFINKPLKRSWIYKSDDNILNKRVECIVNIIEK